MGGNTLTTPLNKRTLLGNIDFSRGGLVMAAGGEGGERLLHCLSH